MPYGDHDVGVSNVNKQPNTYIDLLEDDGRVVILVRLARLQRGSRGGALLARCFVVGGSIVRVDWLVRLRLLGFGHFDLCLELGNLLDHFGCALVVVLNVVLRVDGGRRVRVGTLHCLRSYRERTEQILECLPERSVGEDEMYISERE